MSVVEVGEGRESGASGSGRKSGPEVGRSFGYVTSRETDPVWDVGTPGTSGVRSGEVVGPPV